MGNKSRREILIVKEEIKSREKALRLIYLIYKYVKIVTVLIFPSDKGKGKATKSYSNRLTPFSTLGCWWQAGRKYLR